MLDSEAVGARRMTVDRSLKQKITELYGNKVVVRNGSSKANIAYELKDEERSQCDLAVYIHPEYNAAVVWDVAHHRRCGCNSKSLNLNMVWKLLTDDAMEVHYKKMKSSRGQDEIEKVLYLSIDTLHSILYDLKSYLYFDEDDDEIKAEAVKHRRDSRYKWCDDEPRKRISTSTWKRNKNFRDMVLGAYGNECAICGCTEVKLLEAAHICPVASGGKDILSNGICLCANHHIMLDNGLLKIDFLDREIFEISDSVTMMPWYQVLYKDNPHKKIKYIGEREHGSHQM